MAAVPLDGPSLTLALVEAQVGSLLEVLPVALLITSSTGQILRANDAALELLCSPLPLVGRAVTSAVELARRERSLSVSVRWLQHEGDVLRLYAIHET
jgi:PAS domain-containing protein